MRVILSKEKQKEYIQKVLDKISVKKAAKLCDLSERTIRDWRRGRFTINLDAAEILSAKTGVFIPKEAEIKDDYWYTFLGAHKGAMVCLKKYGRVGGDVEHHKKKWREWWEREGKYKNFNKGIFARKPFNRPEFSEDLAEFVGILLGDGGISQNQVKITFSNLDSGYLQFVVDLIKELFDVPLGIHKRKKAFAFDVIISRIGLVEFCVNELGLKKGDKVKQQIDVPDWIKQNKTYLAACVRGLVDTDGCIFEHSYGVNNKIYSYKKLAFSNRSKPLRDTVFQFLKDCSFSPRITRDRKDVRLDSISDVKRYFDLIGSHNPRYLNKCHS